MILSFALAVLFWVAIVFVVWLSIERPRIFMLASAAILIVLTALLFNDVLYGGH